MSRTDTDVDSTNTRVNASHTLEIIEPRDVPLGGLRAMTVRRTLPNRSRTTIGPWCFIDHYGPDALDDTGGMSVPPHPHTGLQTVSWLFEGEIEHQDSTGVVDLVQPGSVTLMTAGRGVQHSEISTGTHPILHGVQLWVVLPESDRHQEPHCWVGTPYETTLGDAKLSLFAGSLPGLGSVDAPTYWPMFGAQLSLPAGGETTLSIPPEYEMGLLVDTGSLIIDDTTVQEHQLVYLQPGHPPVELRAGADHPTRIIALGGAPFEESIVMWWNFIGRSHDEIVAFRDQWQDGLALGSERFGHLEHMPALPAPEMPSVRLKPRTRR